MIHLLPSRSNRKYRGKYPNRVWSISYSPSADQEWVAKKLSIAKAIHIELNNGNRYIADSIELIAVHNIAGKEWDSIVKAGAIIGTLDQKTYDEMLEGLRLFRAAYDKAARRVKYKQEGGDDGYQYCVRVDGSARYNGLTLREAKYYKDKEILELVSKENVA